MEILSPSSARHDRVKKRPKYQRNAVPEYWVVDGWSRTVERWRPDDDRPEIVSETLVWKPGAVSETLTLHLPEYFSQVLPEAED